MHSTCKRGQAALDFMMTYGWALLLIALAASAIVALGILDTNSFIGSRATGFSQVAPVGWSLSQSGDFNVKLKNNAGSDINVTSIGVAYNTMGCAGAVNVPMPDGAESGVISACSLGSLRAGEGYTMKVGINYTDNETGFPYTDSGTLTGRVL